MCVCVGGGGGIPNRPPRAAPAPNIAMSDVAWCMDSFSSVARKSCKWADNTPLVQVNRDFE